MKLLLLVCFFFIPSLSFGQKEAYILPKIKPNIEILKHEITSGNIAIYYKINFSGMVELRVFNENQKLVYRDQSIINRIEKDKTMFMKLKTNKLKPGKYSYVMSYKNKDVMSTFSIAKN